MSKKYFVFPILFAMIAIFTIWFAQPVYAGLYKWTDDTGRVHYTDDEGKIPIKYRTKNRLKKLRALDDHTVISNVAPGSSNGGKSANGAGPGGKTEKGILSEQEEKAAKDTISFFDSENARSEKYRGKPNYSPTYQKLKVDIKNNLPQKNNLIAALEKSKNPALKDAYGFLKKSGAGDQSRLKAVWQDGYTGGYFGRIISEIETKKTLHGKLQDALEESKKLKAEKLKEEQEKEQQEKENKNTKQAKE